MAIYKKKQQSRKNTKLNSLDVKKIKILVLGASGLLGCHLCSYLESQSYDVIRHGRKKSPNVISADLISWKETNNLLSKVAPDIIINLIAMTSVDQCEEARNEAYQLNLKTVENVAKWLNEVNPSVQLIHISTDHIYDSDGLNSENNTVILNTYALSKYAAEIAALNTNACVLRTNFFGISLNPNRMSFTDWLYSALVQRNPLNIFDDVNFSPLSMQSLSKYISMVIAKKPQGVFNLGSNSGMSKLDFAIYFAKAVNLPTDLINAISVESVDGLLASRPKGMLLDNTKFEVEFDLRLPSLRREIDYIAIQYLKKYKN